MEARLARLEDAFTDVRASLRRLEDGQAKLREDVAELKGRMSQLPTTIQVFTYMLGLLDFAVALSGGIFGVARYFSH